VFVDFKRAFDSVSYSKLVFKLSEIGVNGNLLEIVKSFLCNRTQCVRIANAVSENVKVISGVPQGSVLGPLLFIFYLNDVCSSISNSVLNCFADDAKLYKSITTISDFDLLQNDISNLTKWTLSWQLDISVPKCAILDIVPVNDEYFWDTDIDNNVLELCTLKSDLGIIIDRKLSFSSHIHSITARARQRIHLMFRVFKTRNRAYLLKGFYAYVLPVVSYCSPV